MSEFSQALAAPAFFLIPHSGYLRLEGVDRLPFLQRQTTNDLNLLEPGRALITVLTNPAARILDVFTTFKEDEHLELLTLPGRATSTFQYLRSRIFFRDRVEILNLSHEFVQMDLIGPYIGDALDFPDLSEPPASESLKSSELFGVPTRIIELRNWGWRVIIPAGEARDFASHLEARGIIRLNEKQYETIRIESGRPAAGHELTEDYTPLETGLGFAVSDKKGCYTGQEVIARQITYDKITRRIAGIFLDSETFPGEDVKAAVSGQSIGKITSVAESSRFGWIALAVLKRPHDQPGTAVVIESQWRAISGEVTEIPFQERPSSPRMSL
jgi:folate-binding protein YgfZ